MVHEYQDSQSSWNFQFLNQHRHPHLFNCIFPTHWRNTWNFIFDPSQTHSNYFIDFEKLLHSWKQRTPYKRPFVWTYRGCSLDVPLIQIIWDWGCFFPHWTLLLHLFVCEGRQEWYFAVSISKVVRNVNGSISLLSFGREQHFTLELFTWQDPVFSLWHFVKRNDSEFILQIQLKNSPDLFCGNRRANMLLNIRLLDCLFQIQRSPNGLKRSIDNVSILLGAIHDIEGKQ